jgi:membrane protein YqaA with SNARE-associated domain
MDEARAGRSRRLTYILAGCGLAFLIAVVITTIAFPDVWHALDTYGYLGAFLISILGGATIIIPVPMTPIVAGLGAVLPFPALVGLAAGAGETIGALTIYATGSGGGNAMQDRGRGRLRRWYGWLANAMQKRGWLVLFLVSAVLSPVFYPAALTAGASKYDLKRFVAVVFAGKVIKCMMVAYLGHYGIEAILHLFGR